MDGIPLVEIWRVLRRRWWLVLGLPLATALLSLLLAEPPPQRYEVRLAFAIDVPDSSVVPGSEEGTRAKVAEAMADDLARIIGRDVFAEAIEARLSDDAARSPEDLDIGFASSFSAEDRHRIIDLTVSGSAPPEADAATLERLVDRMTGLALAVVDELDQNAPRWFAYLGEPGVTVTLIDRPDPAVRLPPTLRERLELPLRVALAGLLALLLAFLLHGLDRRVHDPEAAALAAGAPLLARIPRR